MKGLAGGDVGPHKIVLNRSRADGAILGHFLEAAGLATGELIVMAAGDDIAMPQRVRRLVEARQRTGAQIIHSAAERMDDDGRPLPRREFGSPFHRVDDYFPSGRVSHIHGATAAYERKALLAIKPPPFPVFLEDLYLTLMVGMRGGSTAYLAEPLVRFREHAGAYSARVVLGPSAALREQALAERSRDTARLLRHVVDGYRATAGEERAPFQARTLRRDAAFHEAVADWDRRALPARAAALFRARRPGQVRWLLPRLFGRRGVLLLRRLRAALVLRRT
jgi:hypothetical protein